jgi:thiol-disulfide isomerase/thioredoxin
MSAGRGRPRTWSLVWLGGILILALALAILAFVPLLRGGATNTDGSLVGKGAPLLAASDLTGRRWTMDDGRGRLTWINFWATSCVPCRTEMPAMERLAEAYGDRLLVLGVNWGEERSSVVDFTARYAIHYPILLDPTLDNYYRWTRAAGLPRHYFVTGDGTVTREVIGELDPARMARVLASLIGPP